MALGSLGLVLVVLDAEDAKEVIEVEDVLVDGLLVLVNLILSKLLDLIVFLGTLRAGGVVEDSLFRGSRALERQGPAGDPIRFKGEPIHLPVASDHALDVLEAGCVAN